MRITLFALAGGLLGSISLFLLGALLGGNLATSFEFAGLRGYEATGVLGIVAGLLLGVPVGVWLALRSAN